MKLTKAEKRIQDDFKAGKYVKVRLSRKEREEMRQAAATTLARLEGADLIRKVRKDLHISQAKLAKMLQVSKKAVESWEGGWRNVPRPVSLLASLAHDLPAVRTRLLAA